MVRLLIWALLLYVGYRIIKALVTPKETAGKPVESRDSAEITHRDPVCGVYVSEKQAVVGRHNGQRHYFCSMDCLEKFREKLDHTSP